MWPCCFLAGVTPWRFLSLFALPSSSVKSTDVFLDLLRELNEIRYVQIAWNTKSGPSTTVYAPVITVTEGMHPRGGDRAGRRETRSAVPGACGQMFSWLVLQNVPGKPEGGGSFSAAQPLGEPERKPERWFSRGQDSQPSGTPSPPPSTPIA